MITVLIVDDQEGLLRSLKRALDIEGFEVYTATNCSEAWKTSCESRVDVVLLDMVIPGYDALGFLSRLKSERPEIKVVAMSGDSKLTVVAKKADAVLEKPLQMTELRRTLKEILKEV